MNDLMTFSVPCLFGLEGLVGDELRRLNQENVRVETGRVLFDGGVEALAVSNLRLRMGERVLLRLGAFPARSFEELFQGVRALPLEDFLPKDARFPVKGHCLNSQLHSVPDCQAIIKKAAVDRMGRHYGLNWLPETGALYQLQFSFRLLPKNSTALCDFILAYAFFECNINCLFVITYLSMFLLYPFITI